MDQIPAGTQPAANASPVAQQTTPVTAYDPTKPEVQPSLTEDRDPVLTPDVEAKVPASA